MAMKVLCLFLQLACLAASRDWLGPFQRLQVSSPMVVQVITDPSRSKPDLDIAADAMGLGWTVQSQVQPMTFGYTLLLGMDERAARQNFNWPTGGQVATLRVPVPLTGVSATGGCKVLVDEVTGDLSADGGSNLTVQHFNSSFNRSHLFLADAANITVRSGVIGHAFVQAWKGAVVDLMGSTVEATVKVDATSTVLINAVPDATASVAADVTSNVSVAAQANATAKPEEADAGKAARNATNATNATTSATNVTQNGTNATRNATRNATKPADFVTTLVFP